MTAAATVAGQIFQCAADAQQVIETKYEERHLVVDCVSCKIPCSESELSPE